MKTETEPLQYDTAYAELQQIIADLQTDTIGIDELAARIERAQVLIRYCRERLRDVEEKVQEIVF